MYVILLSETCIIKNYSGYQLLLFSSSEQCQVLYIEGDQYKVYIYKLLIILHLRKFRTRVLSGAWKRRARKICTWVFLLLLQKFAYSQTKCKLSFLKISIFIHNVFKLWNVNIIRKITHSLPPVGTRIKIGPH